VTAFPNKVEEHRGQKKLICSVSSVPLWLKNANAEKRLRAIFNQRIPAVNSSVRL
jgi:hypothetical protein